jgi:hypothetical protein
MWIFIGRTNFIQRWVGRVSPSAPGRQGFVCRVRREERSPRGMPNYIGLTAKSAKSAKKGRRHEGHEFSRKLSFEEGPPKGIQALRNRWVKSDNLQSVNMIG